MDERNPGIQPTSPEKDHFDIEVKISDNGNKATFGTSMFINPFHY